MSGHSIVIGGCVGGRVGGVVVVVVECITGGLVGGLVVPLVVVPRVVVPRVVIPRVVDDGGGGGVAKMSLETQCLHACKYFTCTLTLTNSNI